MKETRIEDREKFIWKKNVLDLDKKIKIGVFLLILILPEIMWLFISAFLPGVKENLNVDLGENRALAELPANWKQDDIAEQIEAWYDDHVPFRNYILLTNRKLTGKMEVTYRKKVAPVLARIIYGKGASTVADIDALLAGVYQEEEEQPLETFNPESQENTGHIYEIAEIVPAQCGIPGYTLYSCADCGEQHKDMIPALEHKYTIAEVHEADYLSYGYTYYVCENCGGGLKDDFQGKLIDQSYFAPYALGGNVLQGRFDWLFYTGNRALSYYKGECILTEEEKHTYLEQMQNLKQCCDARGIELRVMIIPNREQVYPEYMPTYELVSDYKRIPRLADYVAANSEMELIYPIKELQASELYMQPYYQYDTHWNMGGAFVGTMALYHSLGMPEVELSNLQMTRVDPDPMWRGLIGTGNLDDAQYPSETDNEYIIEYKSDVVVTPAEGQTKHSMIYETWSNCDNPQNLVYIGDSFRVNLADYITKDFAHTVIGHRDELENMTEYIKNADVLIITSLERFDREMFQVVHDVTQMLQDN